MNTPSWLKREIGGQRSRIQQGTATRDEAIRDLRVQLRDKGEDLVVAILDAWLDDRLGSCGVAASTDTGEQLGLDLQLFPAVVAGVPLPKATLRQLDAHATEMERMTANHARLDRQRREFLARLIRAVDGDLDVALADAARALRTAAAASAAAT